MRRGVLVAISIPIFTSQLEKARGATDAANLRSAYAVAAANKLADDGAHLVLHQQRLLLARLQQDGPLSMRLLVLIQMMPLMGSIQ